MSIGRFKLGRFKLRDGFQGENLYAAEDGEWVRYSDHAAEIERLRTLLKRALPCVRDETVFADHNQGKGLCCDIRAALGEGEKAEKCDYRQHDWQRNNGPEGGIQCRRCGEKFTREDAHHAETGE